MQQIYTQTKMVLFKDPGTKSLKNKKINQENPENRFNLGINFH
jgi:hypothetical protein